MKSWRLKIVDITWLQGGHHFAPQYRNTGLPSAFAAANAASTSPFRQAMPAVSCAGACAAAGAGEATCGAAAELGEGVPVTGGSGDFEHATSAAAAIETRMRKIMIRSARAARE
jgi:hypothetical protein